MDKPTIFFSHSSKDKEAILQIKNKIESVTGGTLDIFMSSDGQSIPFGTNWIYKIEEGLKAAKIMFVFVTEISISSGWIYFEAGYAYSKGIQVIPVGLGIDIGTLKAPLNLLQGFNITSEDSLNNFITIINKTFDYHFNANFSQENFYDIMSLVGTSNYNVVKIEEIIRKIEYSISSEQTINNETKTYALEHYFESIIKYLENNSIQYAKEEKFDYAGNICLMTKGIKILYHKENKEHSNSYRVQSEIGKINFQISPYNFIQSFELLKNLLMLFEDRKNHYIRIFLNDEYNYLKADEDCASLIANSDCFSFNETHIGGYVFGSLKFYIFDEGSNSRERNSNRLMSIVYDCSNITANDIVKLICKLREIGLILKS